METKKRIRASVLKLRDEMQEEERREKSRKIIKNVMNESIYAEAGVILSYVNYKSEVETGELMLQALKDGKKLYCPRVCGINMEFFRILSVDELTEGYMGIREPAAYEENLLTDGDINMQKCLVIMPGSAFDRERNRIGYGKGYYDRYLEQYPRLFSIAVCFECQMVEMVPADAYDKKPDMVITENLIF